MPKIRAFFKKKIKKRIAKSISMSLYEDYLKTCKYTGELPLSKTEYEKRFYDTDDVENYITKTIEDAVTHGTYPKAYIEEEDD